ncbi:NADP-dependent oxidoreductase [Rhizorhabdus argentea]|uniref:NADP-dependent oxidoreductase n=1 Tax=Rhizorhabdus argentea TaxID=1387174 RepID=UPI0030EE0F23
MNNRQVLLATKKPGIPQSDQFRIVETPLRDLNDGEILVRNMFLSVDPAMKGWVADTRDNMSELFEGDVMKAQAVGEVIASRDDGYVKGEILVGFFNWQEYAVITPADVWRRYIETDLPLSLGLGVLGLTGLTAHRALLSLGNPQPGETVLVSTAAGACGSAVGQIAKLKGCRTIGITGSDAKMAICKSRFGYDEAVNYKSTDFEAKLGEVCGGSVNIYFDNTAGPVSDAAHQQLAHFARVVICGTASVANWNPPPLGPRLERLILTHRLRIEGFVVFDHMPRPEEAIAEMAAWVREGKLDYSEDILEGLDSCPDAIAGLYRGDNLGKRIIRI